MNSLAWSAFIAFRLIAAGIVFWAVARHPYSYYILTRWIIFLTCAYGLLVSSKFKPKPPFEIVYILLLALFNPIFPLALPRDTWHVIDVIAGLALTASLIQKPQTQIG